MNTTVIAHSLVSLGLQSFYIRSGNTEKEIRTSHEEYSLLPVTLIQGPINIIGEKVSHFNVPISDNSLFIEGDYEAEDIRLSTLEDSIDVEIWILDDTVNIVFLQPVIILNEYFYGRLQDTAISLISDETTIDFEFSLREDDVETILVGFKVFYGDLGNTHPQHIIPYEINDFTEALFTGFIPGAWIEGERSKTVLPQGNMKNLKIYHDTVENDLLLFVY